jgi:predicted dehydrogenase
MRKIIRFGLVGTGGIAQSYAQAFRQIKQAKLEGVADIREEAVRSFAEDLNCKSFLSHEDLAEAVELDAVIVCTPPSSHPEICLHFLERKIPVLCEKPLALSMDASLTIFEAARRNQVPFTMASKFRYVEDVLRAKGIVSSGSIGEVVLFENAFTARVDMSRRWNAVRSVSGGGVLIDNGTHSVDILRYFVGPIAEIQVVEGKRVQGLEVEDTVRIFVRSRNGIVGNIDLSWSINKEQESYIDIYGSDGTVRVGWRESKYRRSTSQDWIVFGKGYDKVDAFRRQIENFCNALRNTEELRITCEDALASVAVIEAAYKSLRDNNWIQIEPNGAFQ